MYACEHFKKDVLKILGKKVIKPELVKPPAGFGDLGFPVFKLAEKEKINPNKLAKEICSKLKPKGLVSEIKAVGPYINFYADKEKFAGLVLSQVLEMGEKYGAGKKKKQKILIEHTSINPSGPIHIGRFRNPVIGDSLVRIYKFLGYPVLVHYFVNDVGKQVAIILYGKEKEIKPDEKLEKKYINYNEKPDFKIFFIYVPANAEVEKNKKANEEVEKLIQKCESGDKKVIKKMKDIAAECLKGQVEILRKCGFSYDRFIFESDFIQKSKVNKVIEKLKKLKQAKKLENNAYVLDLSGYGIKKEEGTVFQRGDGTSVYVTRDVAYHLEKIKQADLLINVLGEDHKLEAEEVKIVLGLLKEKTEKLEVLFFSFVGLEGRKMTTRLGETIPLDEVIDEGKEKALKEVEKKNPGLSEEGKRKIAESVGIGAIKYYMIKVEPMKKIVFNWEKALDFLGDTGPYLQYTTARVNSIIRKAGSIEADFNVKYLKEKEEKELVDLLAKFPETVEKAGEQLKPYLIANYAYELADKFNCFYHAYQVIQPDLELKKARLALVKSVKNILTNALNLIGIPVLERM